MKTKIFVLIILFGIAGNIFAQDIYLCRSYTEQGDPIDADINWKIKVWGTHISLLFNNGEEPINDELGYFFLDKFDGETYEPFDSKVVKVAEKSNWAVFNYKFTEGGEYIAYFMNSSQNKLAETKVNVEVEETDFISTFVSSRYYDDVEFIFCEAVIKGKPRNRKSKISLEKDLGQIYVYLNSNDSLRTNKLLVNVWRKNPGDVDYEEFIVMKKYKIVSRWFDTFFRFVFTEPGDYKIAVYNDEDYLIKANQILVIE